MTSRWTFVAAVVLIAGGALGFRLGDLKQRPMHGDEAVHTIKFAELWLNGRYEYSTRDYHGPTLYYTTLPSAWLSGAHTYAQTTEWTYRIVPVAFGVGIILLAWPFAAAIGRPAALAGAVLAAVSPAMVFYSRYYIQEMLLVFFAFAAIVTGCRYIRRPCVGWAIACGACLGLMQATKETVIIILPAMALALAPEWLRNLPAKSNRSAMPRRLKARTIIPGVLAGLAVSTVLMSGLLTNPRGALDGWLAYGQYFQRSGGAGIHEHPWHYYADVLLWAKLDAGPVWTEAFIFALAAIGFVMALTGWGIRRQHRPAGRFLGYYTVLLIVAYSAIPYKTPWCSLGFLHGAILLAGIGAAGLVSAAWRFVRRSPEPAPETNSLRLISSHDLPFPVDPADLGSNPPCAPIKDGPFVMTRHPIAGLILAVLVLASLLAGATHLGWQAYRASFVYFDSGYNPHVYAHPLTSAIELSERVEQLAATRGPGQATVYVVADDADYWPLPWYLRRLDAQYAATVPDRLNPPIIVAPPALEPVVFNNVNRIYLFGGEYLLRPAVPLRVWVRQDVWEEYVQAREQRRLQGGSHE